MILKFVGTATAAALFALASASTAQNSDSSASGASGSDKSGSSSSGASASEDKSGPALFAAVDTNSDGQVTKAEWEAYFKSIYGPGWSWPSGGASASGARSGGTSK